MAKLGHLECIANACANAAMRTLHTVYLISSVFQHQLFVHLRVVHSDAAERQVRPEHLNELITPATLTKTFCKLQVVVGSEQGHLSQTPWNKFSLTQLEAL